ncbi:hypothetical protein [Nocardiopsis eucommiae]|uniref:hypothetical protein n=1 Tax=Nocardiopsis eucommiae TaxID=2831970 RepID=UPI003D7476F5
MLDEIPIGAVELEEVPEEALRRLFEAFRLEVVHDKRSKRAHIRVTLAGRPWKGPFRRPDRSPTPEKDQKRKDGNPQKSVPIC